MAEVLDRQGLTYWTSGGTTLGMVRWAGVLVLICPGTVGSSLGMTTLTSVSEIRSEDQDHDHKLGYRMKPSWRRAEL